MIKRLKTILNILLLIFPVGYLLGYIYGYIPVSFNPAPLATYQNFELPADKKPIFYTPEYNIHFYGLENLHPFDTKKYGRIFDQLVAWELLDKNAIYSPPFPSDELLQTVHSKTFIDNLKTNRNALKVSEMFFTAFLPGPFSYKRMVVPQLYATSGTVLAAKSALDRGWAINLSGGYHHASSNDAGGFCFVADISLAIENILSSTPVQRIMYVDLDAHQGNGPARDAINRDDIYVYDMFTAAIYPMDSKAYAGADTLIKLNTRTDDSAYMQKLSSTLPAAIEAFKPELILYNAGTDVLQHDPLGYQSLTANGIKDRDAFVFAQARSRNIPIAMVLSGGYQMNNAEVIAQSIRNLHNSNLIDLK